MKSVLALLDIKELMILSGLLTFILILGKFTNLSFSYGEYFFVLVFFGISKIVDVKEVQADLSTLNLGENRQIIVLEKVILFKDEKLHRKLYLFKRFVAFLLLALVIIQDVLVNMKIIDPI